MDDLRSPWSECYSETLLNLLSVYCKGLFDNTVKLEHSVPNYILNWGRRLRFFIHLHFLITLFIAIAVFFRNIGIIDLKGIEVCLRWSKLTHWMLALSLLPFHYFFLNLEMWPVIMLYLTNGQVLAIPWINTQIETGHFFFFFELKKEVDNTIQQRCCVSYRKLF